MVSATYPVISDVRDVSSFFADRYSSNQVSGSAAGDRRSAYDIDGFRVTVDVPQSRLTITGEDDLGSFATLLCASLLTRVDKFDMGRIIDGGTA